MSDRGVAPTLNFATLAIVAAVALTLSAPPALADLKDTVAFDVPAQQLPSALNRYSEQAGVQITSPGQLIEGKMSTGITGKLGARVALDLLLKDTQLRYDVIDERTVVIVAVEGAAGTNHQARAGYGDSSIRVAQNEQTGRTGAQNAANGGDERTASERSSEDPNSLPPTGEDSGGGEGMPEVLIQGSRSLNADIERTRDDVQPYTILNRKALETSSAADLGEFLRNQLSQTTSFSMASQVAGSGHVSSINLRGLGADETVILVNGRRIAGDGASGTFQQSDINGIPLNAIERIEVLPTTASGIYGGSATGGVVNVILRKDYSGLEVQATYGNTFASDVATRRIGVAGGLDLGRANLMFAAGFADSNPLLTGERDLIQRATDLIFANTPEAILQARTPPLGTMTNIRSEDGSILVLDNGVSLGSAIAHVPQGYGGRVIDEGAAFLATAGSYNLGLSNTAVNPNGARRNLLATPETKSFTGTLRSEFTSWLEGFMELAGTETTSTFLSNSVPVTFTIPGTAANNPFQQTIRVTIPPIGGDQTFFSETSNWRVVGGLIARLPHDWSGEVDYAFSGSESYSSSPATTGFSAAGTAAVQNGTLDVLRDTNEFPVNFGSYITVPDSSGGPFDATLKNAALRLAGPLWWSLPGGTPAVSILMERREDELGDATTGTVDGSIQFIYPEQRQTVDSVYIETHVPLLGIESRVPLVRELELQLALRHDEYLVDGAGTLTSASQPVNRFRNRSRSTNPTLGFRWNLTEDTMLRASYGTGYRPPAVDQLIPGPSLPVSAALLSLFGITDPLRGNEPLGDVSVETGGGDNLRPEESTSRSAGIILTPRSLPGFRLSIDWTQIEKVDNIQSILRLNQSDFDNEPFVPGLIIRAAPQNDGFSVGRVIGMNGALVNVSRLDVEAYDVALDYSFQSRLGTYVLAVNGTRLEHLQAQVTPLAPVVENVGLRGGGGGLRWKANGRLSWRHRGLELGWVSRYFDKYWLNAARTFVLSQGSATVPSQIYHDFYASYEIADEPVLGSAWLSNMEVSIQINNVLDKRPPSEGGQYSPLGDPRLAHYVFSLRKRF